MKVKYTRISTANQNTERQLINQKDFDKVYIDVCSGSIPFAERSEAMKVWNNENITQLAVKDIDRLGRSLKDILHTIEHFTAKGVDVYIEGLGLHTMVNGKKNDTASLMINLLGSIAEHERNMIRERTQQGREIAKTKNKFKGRKRGAVMSDDKFMQKHYNEIQLVKGLLKGGESILNASKLANVPRSLIYSMKNRNLL
jgi:DNA invertase Pin-like site-specific DNA recombinase